VAYHQRVQTPLPPGNHRGSGWFGLSGSNTAT
jgi:hypothetical protein